ncbi:hypothetical protein E4U40_000519 [Claviceps sp. LM458 group G5]|nr:hypothetical protein E4U40_000519 [Claviceps sp. LM458 group G5]
MTISHDNEYEDEQKDELLENATIIDIRYCRHLNHLTRDITVVSTTSITVSSEDNGCTLAPQRPRILLRSAVVCHSRRYSLRHLEFFEYGHLITE